MSNSRTALEGWFRKDDNDYRERTVVISLVSDSGYEANAYRGEQIAQTSWSGHESMEDALDELNARLEAVGEDLER